MKKQKIEYSFNLDFEIFRRSFSYREVVSAIAVALSFFSGARFVLYNDIEISTTVIGILFCLLPLSNHIIYRLEHKRSNNLIGRWLHDCILLLCFWVIQAIANYTNGNQIQIEDDIIAMLLLMILFFAFEWVVGLLMQLLNKLEWRIL